MELAPYNMQNWQEYVSWFKRRGAPVPPPPIHAVFVSHDGDLIIGCCYYVGDPPYMYFEHLCSNPDVSPSLSHRALVFGVRAIMAMGTFHSRIVLIFARHQGIINVLKKCGFHQEPSVVFYAVPGAEIKTPPVRKTDRGVTGGDSKPGDDVTAEPEKKVSRKRMTVKRRRKK